MFICLFCSIALSLKHIYKKKFIVVNDEYTDETLSHLNVFDGTIGANLFKHLGTKVIFDFDNMRIEGKD